MEVKKLLCEFVGRRAVHAKAPHALDYRVIGREHLGCKRGGRGGKGNNGERRQAYAREQYCDMHVHE